MHPLKTNIDKSVSQFRMKFVILSDGCLLKYIMYCYRAEGLLAQMVNIRLPVKFKLHTVCTRSVRGIWNLEKRSGRLELLPYHG